MHYIQKHILRELTLHKSQRFAQLRPKQVESNLFIYHLKALIKEGYVQKNTSGSYGLAPAGKRFVDRISMEKFEPRIQPKILTLLIIKNKRGELLLWKRKKQPFLGKIGFPTGKIHLGESLGEAAKRELAEKTAVTASLKHVGDGYLTIFESKELISQVLFHCFVGTAKSNNFMKHANLHWGKLITETELIPGAKEIYAAASKAKGHFFVEIVK
jgi:ADP-ribose pyrophosphatase YjhB (NUDIX family)